MFNSSADDKSKDKDMTRKRDHKDSRDEQKLRLRKEELDVSKNRVDIGKVEFGKEIIEELKIVNVPVIHEEIVIEELIIEKNFTDTESPETIHIPIKEERVEILKHTYDLEKVKIDKHQVYTTEIVNTIIKKEVVHLKITGNVDFEIL